jgi:hypothetical protein
MKTIVEILIFGVVFGAFGALIYHHILWGKRKNAESDLIYLEFLIQQSTLDHISKENIERIITEYRGRDDMDKVKLELLDK